MYSFRLFLAWLIMAAIPLQGLAAASMLFCGTGEHHAPAQVVTAIDQHDHSMHGHADEVPSQQAVDETGKKLPNLAHKCSACSSCCSSVALTQFPQLGALVPVPQAELTEPFVLIHARPAQVPDKPPRA